MISRFARRPITRLLAVTFAAVVLGMGSALLSGLDAVEQASIDQRFILRGARPANSDIVIVGLDQRSLGALNERPPISRQRYARLLDRLRQSDARVIVLDVQFIGRTTVTADDALIEAIRRCGPVVLATHDGSGGPIAVPAGRTHVPGAVLGSAAVDVDRDGVLRRMMYAPLEMRTLAVLAAEQWLRAPANQAAFNNNNVWVDFAGPPGTYPMYSLVDVLDGTVGSSELAGKIVVVGITDPTERDVFVTPTASAPMSGAEYQANAIATAIADYPLKSSGPAFLVLVTAAAAAVPAIAGLRLAVLPVLAVSFGAMGLWLAGSQVLFLGGFIVPIVPPVVAILISCAATVGLVSWQDRRLRREAESAYAALPIHTQIRWFISYRRDQTGWAAQWISEGLERRFGNGTVFIDRDSIHVGQDWENRILSVVPACEAVLVLIGPYWLKAVDPSGRQRIRLQDDWVRQEIEAALDSPDVTVVPVLLDGATLPSASELPDSIVGLLRYNAFTLTKALDEDALDDLAESLRSGRLDDALREVRESAPRRQAQVPKK